MADLQDRNNNQLYQRDKAARVGIEPTKIVSKTITDPFGFRAKLLTSRSGC